MISHDYAQPSSYQLKRSYKKYLRLAGTVVGAASVLGGAYLLLHNSKHSSAPSKQPQHQAVQKVLPARIVPLKPVTPPIAKHDMRVITPTLPSKPSAKPVAHSIAQHAAGKQYDFYHLLSHNPTAMLSSTIDTSPTHAVATIRAGHYIQVGLYKQKPYALQQVAQLESKHIHASLQTIHPNQNIRYRVLVGPFKTLEAAETQRQHFVAAKIPGVVVSPATKNS